MPKIIQSVSVIFVSWIALRILNIGAVDAGMFSSGIGFFLYISASLVEWFEKLKYKLFDIDKSIAELKQFKKDATQITPLQPSINDEIIDGSKQPNQTSSQPHEI